MSLPTKDTVVQFRKGPEVLLAVVTDAKGGRIVATDAKGKRHMLPPARVLQAAGPLGASGDRERGERLRHLAESAGEAQAAVDLPLLWAAARERSGTLAISDLTELYLGCGGEPAERLGVGLALCRDNTYFKQTGSGFRPRMEAEVQKRLREREAARRAQQTRRLFIEWVRSTCARASGGEGGGGGGGVGEGKDTPPPRAAAPEGAEAPLALLEELAVRGDEAPRARQARQLLKEIAEGAGAPAQVAQTAEGAFSLLERLGVFGPHENLWLRRLEVPTGFSPAVLRAAAEVPEYRYDPATEPWRRDLRALDTFTVDNRDTRDRDDAVTLIRTPQGGYELWVHVVDPTPFVRPGSLLDEEALRRGTSVYLPTGAVPMLPPALCEARMSLEAGTERPALSLHVQIGADGAVAGAELTRSAISIDRNLSYEEADLGAERGDATLGALCELGRVLWAGREARGALNLNTEERVVRVDPVSYEVTVRVEPCRTPSREAIAELAVLANGEVAAFCRARRIPAIFRRQVAPRQTLPRLEDLPSRLVWANEVRRQLGRTQTGLEPGPHHSLGLDAYVQATSPIRRYQDLLHHRQLAAALSGNPLPYDAERFLQVAAAAEASSSAARVCERETIRYWLLEYLRRSRGAELEGVTLARARDGRLLVHVSRVAHRFPVPYPGALPLGTAVAVRIQHVDPRRGTVRLRIEPRTAPPP